MPWLSTKICGSASGKMAQEIILYSNDLHVAMVHSLHKTR